ncbi:MAG: 30S ribosomal protein S9 [Enterobacteriaceae bacterium]
MRKAGFVTRDARQVERKKVGLRKSTSSSSVLQRWYSAGRRIPEKTRFGGFLSLFLASDPR